MKEGNFPLVSVVIPTFNSSHFLERCLLSVKQQTYPLIEIIVVDNNSSDNTREIAACYSSKIFVHGPERSAQVNWGASQAKGKYLYRIDSDFILEPTVVSECVEKCECRGYDSIAVHNASDGSVSFWAKVQALERETYRDDTLIVGVRFWRADVFRAVGGFDETLIAGEDFDLHNRIIDAGYTFGRVQAQELHLGEPHSLVDVWRRGYRYGGSHWYYLRRHPKRGLKQIWPIRPSYFRHWRLLVRQPILTLGLIVLISVKYIGAFCGGGVHLCRELLQRK